MKAAYVEMFREAADGEREGSVCFRLVDAKGQGLTGDSFCSDQLAREVGTTLRFQVADSASRFIDPLVPQADHVAAWIDRMGCIDFIGDVTDGDRMHPSYYQAACGESDRSRKEAALWWS